MKKVVLLLLLLTAFLSCNGQENKTTYTQKVEYGLKGAVKKVTSYIYKVENGKIPAKTAKYNNGKTTKTFDSMGNLVTMNKLWDLGFLGKSEYSYLYFGRGKEISFKETAHLHNGKVTKRTCKYVWSDDYNYTILSPDDNTYTIMYTLDKNYQIVKSIFKKNGDIESIDETETIYNNDKIQETKTKMTYESLDGKIIYQIQVAQKYDLRGNPTVTYIYGDLNKQKLESVIYNEYSYY